MLTGYTCESDDKYFVVIIIFFSCRYHTENPYRPPIAVNASHIYIYFTPSKSVPFFRTRLCTLYTTDNI